MLLTIHGLCPYVSLHVHFPFLRIVWQKKKLYGVFLPFILVVT